MRQAVVYVLTIYNGAVYITTLSLLSKIMDLCSRSRGSECSAFCERTLLELALVLPQGEPDLTRVFSSGKETDN
ncbi:hypothetical protein BDN67DRAFT_1052885 [Paxillus ammoniavirescens]|nr:hypothetical protein BDN67DRAFT_1052885 [Paxillus ammoniavirescens]